MTSRHFPLRIDPAWASPLKVFGVRASTSGVTLDEAGFDARFGRFRVVTPWENLREVSVTGPFRWYRAIGPRLSLADKGVTFGSSTAGGVCVRFHRPVAALFGDKQVHPGLTVTVADPEGLRDAIEARLTSQG